MSKHRPAFRSVRTEAERFTKSTGSSLPPVTLIFAFGRDRSHSLSVPLVIRYSLGAVALAATVEFRWSLKVF